MTEQYASDGRDFISCEFLVVVVSRVRFAFKLKSTSG